MYFASREEAKKAIIAQVPAFCIFLESILGHDLYAYLKRVSQNNDIYLFSGIIRDFLLGDSSAFTPRDIDLVVGGNFNVSHLNLIQKLFPRQNSFRGIKLTFKNLTIDVWNIKDTWGIRNFEQKNNVNALLKSSFFNFSSIVYSFRDAKFIFDDAFVDFLITRKIEIVLSENPNLGLSLFNIYYYTTKLDAQVGGSLASWIERNFCILIDYHSIQKKHFGNATISSNKIVSFLINIKSSHV